MRNPISLLANWTGGADDDGQAVNLGSIGSWALHEESAEVSAPLAWTDGYEIDPDAPTTITGRTFGEEPE